MKSKRYFSTTSYLKAPYVFTDIKNSSMKPFFSLFLFFTFSLLSAQQREIDSIKNVIQSQEGLEKIQSLNELSWYYRNIEMDSAFYFVNDAVAIAEQLADKRGIQAAYNSLANVFDAVSMLDSAEFYHLKALEIRIELKDSSNIAGSYNNLGVLYDYKNQIEKSLEMYFQALKIYESLKDDPYSVAMVMSNIGIVYKKQKDFQNVLDYYQKAQKIYEDVESGFGITVTKGNIGFVLINLKRFEESLSTSQSALEGYQRLGYDRYVPSIEQNIAIAYDSLGNETLAREYYESSIRHHGENQNFYELANAGLSYADFLYRNKEFQKGIETIAISLENAKKSESTDLIVSGTKYKAKFLASLGNFREAFQEFEKFSTGNDSLFEENKTKQIFELREQYESEKKDKKLLVQELEIKEKSAAIQLQVIIIVVLIIGASILYYWYREKKKQQLIQSQLAMNQERTRIAMDLHDHVGAELTLISSKLDTRIFKEERKKDQEDLTNISNQVRGVSSTLRETVWSIRNESISIDELIIQIETFASKLLEKSELKLLTETGKPELILLPQHALSLFRICQEAITNAFKYSEADLITISIQIVENELLLKIDDDGKGFNVSEAKKGYGLQNMDQRVQQLKGGFSINSKLGSSTKIKINIPLG